MIKACESLTFTLDLVLSSMNFILKEYKKDKEQYVNNEIMTLMYNSGWVKMNKYYQLSDSTSTYVAVLVLHSDHKWTYIDKHWEYSWKASAKKLMQEFWEKFYKSALQISSN